VLISSADRGARGKLEGEEIEGTIPEELGDGGHKRSLSALLEVEAL
jgi:hypothetical protein